MLSALSHTPKRLGILTIKHFMEINLEKFNWLTPHYFITYKTQHAIRSMKILSYFF